MSDPASAPVAPSDPDALALGHAQIVLILVGLVASGKSSFASALERHYPQFRRCCQDELGDRRAVEGAARAALREGLSVCVDRTNIDATQRAHWINIAHEFPGVPAWILLFDTPYNVCAERLQLRHDHPTIRDAAAGLRILARFASEVAPPAPSEGHERLLALAPAQLPPAGAYSRADVRAVLHRVRDAPPSRGGHGVERSVGGGRGRARVDARSPYARSSYRGAHTGYAARGSSSRAAGSSSWGAGSSSWGAGSQSRGAGLSSRGAGSSSWRTGPERTRSGVSRAPETPWRGRGTVLAPTRTETGGQWGASRAGNASRASGAGSAQDPLVDD
ncbi:hypothetical protein FA95DRAFT_253892 [Auriscalpium vulgare]|uniref:Uncharacterized protein n=1 Tax=Auriscalpium vulgare TaxID=40419 RepID=A0ACB8RK17_9AGAM|nr:hypothetical protein FA95DRAFT_253892 [Auriscalpium vulgare]